MGGGRTCNRRLLYIALLQKEKKRKTGWRGGVLLIRGDKTVDTTEARAGRDKGKSGLSMIYLLNLVLDTDQKKKRPPWRWRLTTEGLHDWHKHFLSNAK